MAFLKKAATYFGFKSSWADVDAEEDSNQEGGPTPGFSVKREVVVEQARLPLITVAKGRPAVVEGLSWYADRLRTDPDGDEACEFYEECPAGPSSGAAPGPPLPSSSSTVGRTGGSTGGGLRPVAGSAAFPPAPGRLWDKVAAGMPVSLRGRYTAAEWAGLGGDAGGAGTGTAAGGEGQGL